MELKIWLRGHYDTPLARQHENDDDDDGGGGEGKKGDNGNFSPMGNHDDVAETTRLNIETLTAGLGRNDATIRFLFW
jgi:hypothetical protein